jgi:hypothetical protein
MDFINDNNFIPATSRHKTYFIFEFSNLLDSPVGGPINLLQVKTTPFSYLQTGSTDVAAESIKVSRPW